MAAYYNEIDPKAAAWLRELIKQGHIADGVVDERSIVDVTPDELRGFTQCHFFAGIGVWSYALRSAGWADDRPVWTGSCPCQPFSAAGRRGGVDDERHLWPHWHHLISQCQPTIVFGEQVASKDGLGWLDLVSTDMEATGYAFGAADLCAAGIGAPHIRQRLFFGAVRLADASGEHLRRGLGQRDGAKGFAQGEAWERERGRDDHSLGSADGGLADTDGWQRGRIADGEGRQRDGAPTGRQQGDSESERGGAGFGMADADDPGPHGRTGMSECATERLAGASGVADGMEHTSGDGRQQWRAEPSGRGATSGRSDCRLADAEYERLAGCVSGCGEKPSVESSGQAGHNAGRCETDAGRTSPSHNHWRDADWLYCRDGKWRPVEPGTFPLAHGVAQRVGRLRGYGNAIVAQAACQFIQAFDAALRA